MRCIVLYNEHLYVMNTHMVFITEKTLNNEIGATNRTIICSSSIHQMAGFRDYKRPIVFLSFIILIHLEEWLLIILKILVTKASKVHAHHIEMI